MLIIRVKDYYEVEISKCHKENYLVYVSASLNLLS